MPEVAKIETAVLTTVADELPLLARIARATASANNLANAKRAEQQREKVGQAAERVAELSKTLFWHWSAVRVLRRNGVQVEVSAAAAAAAPAATMARDAADAAGRDVAELLANHDAAKFKRQVDNLANKLDAAAAAAWQAHVQERVDPSADLLKTFGVLPSFKEQVETIQHSANDLRRRMVPRDEAQWRSFEEAAESLKEAVAAFAERAGTNLPEDVAIFLRKAMEAGAGLCDLTAEVLAWLRTHGVEGDFSIVIRGGSAGSYHRGRA